MDKKEELEKLKKALSDLNSKSVEISDKIHKIEQENVQMSKKDGSGPQLVNL